MSSNDQQTHEARAANEQPCSLHSPRLSFSKSGETCRGNLDAGKTMSASHTDKSSFEPTLDVKKSGLVCLNISTSFSASSNHSRTASSLPSSMSDHSSVTRWYHWTTSFSTLASACRSSAIDNFCFAFPLLPRTFSSNKDAGA